MEITSTPQTVILCLAGDLSADPAEIVEVIRENNLVAQFREAVNDFSANYSALLEEVNSLC